MAPTDAGSCDTLLCLSGSDAAQVLQGQTTAAFVDLAENSTVYGAFCNPKGRILADFCAFVLRPERIILRLRDGIAEPLMTHLTPYIRFSKSQLTRLDWRIHYWQHPVEAVIDKVIVPTDHCVAVAKDTQFCEVWSREEIDKPNADWQPLEATQWRLLDISRGEARIESTTVGLYLPQDLNYDQRGWVNFKKGCYTGQEIIARLHYRGTPKRRLYRAFCDTDQCPEPGLPVSISAEGPTTGSVVNAARDLNTGRYELLVETTEETVAEGGFLQRQPSRPLGFY